MIVDNRPHEYKSVKHIGSVIMEAPGEHAGYFEDTWPSVLEAIRALAEDACG